MAPAIPQRPWSDDNRAMTESWKWAPKVFPGVSRSPRNRLPVGHVHSVPTIGRPGTGSGITGGIDDVQDPFRDKLLRGIPAVPGNRTTEQRARAAFAHMVGFHEREERACRAEFARLSQLPASKFATERRAIAGLKAVEDTDKTCSGIITRCRFPLQEVDARTDDGVYLAGGIQIGEVKAVDIANHAIDIQNFGASPDPHPDRVFLHRHVPTEVLRSSLLRLGQTVLEKGLALDGIYRTASSLLLRRPPPGLGSDGTARQPEETTVDAACRLALALDGGVLAAQGPPGTGKTYTGGQVIAALVRAGLKVGATAVSHKVIVNLLEAVSRQARAARQPMTLVHRQKGTYEGEWDIRRDYWYDRILEDLHGGETDVLGATAWCWSRPEFAQSVDVLVVDEAGQMSLANVLACAPAGSSLVLLGDPQQLEQPLQASHPEGSAISALAYLLDGAETMPPDKGLFLPETYRLHPRIAKYTSSVFYESRVEVRAGLQRQAIVARGDAGIPLPGSGLVHVPVPHAGNAVRSPEEVAVIVELVAMLIGRCDWRNRDGEVRRLTGRDLLLVAPYNAQVYALTAELPTIADRIGTVDRFQGQEAPVVIYSMTSSGPEVAPRGMEFLYDHRRLNVATSRARALCILVGSPWAVEPVCRSRRDEALARPVREFLRHAHVVPVSSIAPGQDSWPGVG